MFRYEHVYIESPRVNAGGSTVAKHSVSVGDYILEHAQLNPSQATKNVCRARLVFNPKVRSDSDVEYVQHILSGFIKDETDVLVTDSPRPFRGPGYFFGMHVAGANTESLEMFLIYRKVEPQQEGFG